MVDDHGHGPAGHRGHETTDVKMRPIVVMTVLIAAACVIALVGMVPLFDYLEQREAAVDEPLSPLAEPNPLPPEPRLQARPQTDLEAYRLRSTEQLETYQWIDRDAGVVQIPVERAMELILERGLPPVEAAAPESPPQ